jgi:hypothetical protein
LSCDQDAFEVGLGGFQLGLLVLPGGAEFGEGVFDVLTMRIVVNNLLQRLLFGSGLRPRAAPPWRTAMTARTSRTAETAGTPHADFHIPTRVHYFLNLGLNDGPFIIVGDIQVLPNSVHHPLLELGWVKAGARSAGATGPARASAVVILSEQVSAARPQGGGHSQNAEHYLTFHESFSSH